MSTEMDKEIASVVEKHLPAAMAATLVDRLNKMAELERVNESLQRRVGQLSEDVSKLQERETSVYSLEQKVNRRVAECEARELSVSKREFNADVVEARLKCAEDRVQFARETLGVVFGNNRYKYSETVSRNGNEIAGVGQYESCGQKYSQPYTAPVSSTTTKNVVSEG